MVTITRNLTCELGETSYCKWPEPLVIPDLSKIVSGMVQSLVLCTKGLLDGVPVCEGPLIFLTIQSLILMVVSLGWCQKGRSYLFSDYGDMTVTPHYYSRVDWWTLVSGHKYFVFVWTICNTTFSLNFCYWTSFPSLKCIRHFVSLSLLLFPLTIHNHRVNKSREPRQITLLFRTKNHYSKVENDFSTSGDDPLRRHSPRPPNSPLPRPLRPGWQPFGLKPTRA